jgi:hypothetical protein
MSARADATESTDVETLAQVVEELEETVERQADRIEELEETAETQRRVFSSAIAAQAERIGDLEEELAEHKDHTGREFAAVRRRVTDVEEDVEAAATAPSENDETVADEKGSENLRDPSTGADTETPLERICSLPEHVADRELTRNQHRARFVAKDVRDYAEKVPAGLVIDSRAIKRVLTASEGKRPHTQTVARVMDFLDDLGKDDVELIKRRGRKLVVFDPEAVDRLSQCGDRGGGSNVRSDVIGPA